VAQQELLLGYLVKPPTEPSGLHVAVDGEGQIIGRSRNADDLVEVVGNHMRTRASNEPVPGQLRVRLRALIDEDQSISLLGQHVGANPNFSERQLARHGLKIIDSSYVDLHVQSQLVQIVDSAGNLAPVGVVGHVSLDRAKGTVDRLFLLNVTGTPFTPGQVAHQLACAVRSGSRHERVSSAVALANALTIIEVGTSASTDVIASVAKRD